MRSEMPADFLSQNAVDAVAIVGRVKRNKEDC